MRITKRNWYKLFLYFIFMVISRGLVVLGILLGLYTMYAYFFVENFNGSVNYFLYTSLCLVIGSIFDSLYEKLKKTT